MCFVFLPQVIANLGHFNGEVVNWLGYTYPVTIWGEHLAFIPAPIRASRTPEPIA